MLKNRLSGLQYLVLLCDEETEVACRNIENFFKNNQLLM
jgi:hypothetical protein